MALIVYGRKGNILTTLTDPEFLVLSRSPEIPPVLPDYNACPFQFLTMGKPRLFYSAPARSTMLQPELRGAYEDYLLGYGRIADQQEGKGQLVHTP